MSLVDPATRKMACDAVRNCPARDDQCEVESVASWIRSKITYRGEIPGFDLFQKIGVSVDLAAGDCDCMTIAGIALLTEIGYVCGVRIVMFSQSEGHAYQILRLPRLTNGQQSVVPLDLSEPVAVGWEVDRGQTISAVDYWFEPVAWIAWKQSGQPLSRSPMPRAEPAAPPV